MNPNECRSVRALLNITQIEFAQSAQVGITNVVYFERRGQGVSSQAIIAIKTALEKLGVEFVETSEAKGVRLRNSSIVESRFGIDPAQVRAARALLD